jgi:hypothetical protein
MSTDDKGDRNQYKSSPSFHMISDGGTKLRKNPAIIYLVYLFVLAAMGVYYSISGLFPSHKAITRITNYQDSEFYN